MKTYSKKILFYIFSATVLLIIISNFYLLYSIRNKAVDTVKEEAHKTAVIADKIMSEDNFAPLDSLLLQKKISRISFLTGHTIFFIDKNGNVISSDTTSSKKRKASNPLEEPDVKKAMKIGYGFYRFSDSSSDAESFFYSEPVKPNGKMIGFVRIKIYPDEYYHKVNFVIPVIIFIDILIIAFAFLLFFVIIYDFKKSFTSLLLPMKRSLEDKTFEIIPPQNIYEFQELAFSFNSFAECIIKKYKMKKEEHYLIEELLESLEDGIAAFDEESRLIFSNGFFDKLFNISSDKKNHIYDIIDFPPLINDVNKFLSDKNPIYRETKFYGEKYINYSILPLSLEAGKPGFTIVVRDITEKHRLEKIRTDFVANVSHEFKTPLTSIRGFAETLLNNEIIDEDLRERFLLKIKHQTDYLENLVTDLLKLNRIEKNQLVELEKINIIPIIDDIIEEFIPKAAQAKQKLIYNKNVPDKVEVIANDNLIRNILSNLIANAIQYSKADSTIKVYLNISEDYLKIEVEDKGIGIPAKELPRIFERFYRTQDAKNKFSTGSGLGLSIVKNAVELLNGKHGAESVPGEGSIFRCEIPLAK